MNLKNNIYKKVTSVESPAAPTPEQRGGEPGGNIKESHGPAATIKHNGVHGLRSHEKLLCHCDDELG